MLNTSNEICVYSNILSTASITIVATKYFKISRFDWIKGNEKQITHLKYINNLRRLCYWRLVCYMYIVFITF